VVALAPTSLILAIEWLKNHMYSYYYVYIYDFKAVQYTIDLKGLAPRGLAMRY
jgi:hypothetical protein